MTSWLTTAPRLRPSLRRSPFQTNASPGHISYNLSVPSILRPGRIAYLTLTFSNDGVPMHRRRCLSSRSRAATPHRAAGRDQLFGVKRADPRDRDHRAGRDAPARLSRHAADSLRADHARGRRLDQFWLAGLDRRQRADELVVAGIEPPTVVHLDRGLEAVFANLTADPGPDDGDLPGRPDGEATYLSQLGEYTDVVQRLLDSR